MLKTKHKNGKMRQKKQRQNIWTKRQLFVMKWQKNTQKNNFYRENFHFCVFFCKKKWKGEKMEIHKCF